MLWQVVMIECVYYNMQTAWIINFFDASDTIGLSAYGRHKSHICLQQIFRKLWVLYVHSVRHKYFYGEGSNFWSKSTTFTPFDCPPNRGNFMVLLLYTTKSWFQNPTTIVPQQRRAGYYRLVFHQPVLSGKNDVRTHTVGCSPNKPFATQYLSVLIR